MSETPYGVGWSRRFVLKAAFYLPLILKFADDDVL